MARIKVFDKTTQTWVYADKSFGKDGTDGKDGISPTVAVSKSGKVTSISITDKNGTKNATINDGTDGSPGSNGKDGTSVTVTKVTESADDGGSNVVEFSDGTTVTIKNGKKGSDGKNPVKGIDYWTDADQEAMVQQVITALGTPVFGRVEEGNKITFSTEHLADGTYYFGYEDEDGNWVEIGTVEVGGSGGMGDSGSVELIWADNVKLDKTTGAENTGDQYAASQMIELVDGYTYTTNQVFIDTWTFGGVSICYYGENGAYLGYEELWASSDQEQTKTLTPISGAVSFRVRLFKGANTLVPARYSVTYEKTA